MHKSPDKSIFTASGPTNDKRLTSNLSLNQTNNIRQFTIRQRKMWQLLVYPDSLILTLLAHLAQGEREWINDKSETNNSQVTRVEKNSEGKKGCGRGCEWMWNYSTCAIYTKKDYRLCFSSLTADGLASKSYNEWGRHTRRVARVVLRTRLHQCEGL